MVEEDNVSCLEAETNMKEKGKNLEGISRRTGWFDLPRNGGGDIDLADYPLDYQRKKVINYDNLP